MMDKKIHLHLTFRRNRSIFVFFFVMSGVHLLYPIILLDGQLAREVNDSFRTGLLSDLAALFLSAGASFRFSSVDFNKAAPTVLLREGGRYRWSRCEEGTGA